VTQGLSSTLANGQFLHAVRSPAHHEPQRASAPNGLVTTPGSGSRGCTCHCTTPPSTCRRITSPTEEEENSGEEATDDRIDARTRHLRVLGGKDCRFLPCATTVRRDYESQILEGCAGKHILEYGCGLGSYSMKLTTRGAASPVSTSHSGDPTRTEDGGRGLRIDFRVITRVPDS